MRKTKSGFDNAWLAGFIDADGSFAIRQTLETRGKKLTECAFILVQRRYDSQTDSSYDFVFEGIARFLKCRVKSVLPHNGKEQVKLKLSSALCKAKLRTYLTSWPLLSSKHLDFQAWCRVDDLINAQKHYLTSGVDEIRKIKKTINNQRTCFCWYHLELYF